MSAIKTHEKFTAEEARYISPFFTNLDKNVFVAKYLPSEVLGALASRYSRSTKGVRRLFFDEYIKPILEPNLEGENKKSVQEAEKMRKELISFVDYLNEHGGFDAVVNSNRARAFFSKWLAAYGDDSIAQLAGAHIFFENISSLAADNLQEYRIGFAPLEKSSRYVPFDAKVNNKWPYYVDGDILKSKWGKEYMKLLNLLFLRYSKSIMPLMKYLKRKYRKQKDQTDRAYMSTLKAKAFDELRVYLPAAHYTNVGFFGVGQVFEYVITKSLASPLREMRDIGLEMQRELKKVIPSMVERATSPRGRVYQRYVSGTDIRMQKVTIQMLGAQSGSIDKGVTLVEYDMDAEDKIIASLLYKYSKISQEEIKRRVAKLNERDKQKIITTAFKGRKVRQHRLLRAFENTYYKFDIVANIGAYRDLHRHRMHTHERQRFTTEHGYDISQEMKNSKFDKQYVEAARKVDIFYKKLSIKYPEQAQYIVTKGHRVRWYQWQNLRQLGWEAELRTGPQGHPDYRIVEQEKVRLVQEVHPNLAKVLQFVDFQEYDLARRESEKKIDKKLGIKLRR